jgi:hypothetical protein
MKSKFLSMLAVAGAVLAAPFKAPRSREVYGPKPRAPEPEPFPEAVPMHFPERLLRVPALPVGLSVADKAREFGARMNAFYGQRPRSWLSPNARARALKARGRK